MAKSRSELRNIVMVILYQIDIYESREVPFSVDEVIKENLSVDNDFVRSIVYGVTTYKDELDEIANKYIEGWTIDRIDKTGAAILRMGLYELKFTDTPEIVVINEAIELAKRYCDDAVRKIINAVLDRYIKD
jgi:N utilization substance protein B